MVRLDVLDIGTFTLLWFGMHDNFVTTLVREIFLYAKLRVLLLKQFLFVAFRLVEDYRIH